MFANPFQSKVNSMVGGETERGRLPRARHPFLDRKRNSALFSSFFQFQHSSSSSPSANMYFEMWCCCGHNGAVGRSRSSPRRSHHPIHPSLQLCLSRLQHSCRRRHRRRRLAAVVILGRGENPGWAPRHRQTSLLRSLILVVLYSPWAAVAAPAAASPTPAPRRPFSFWRE